MAVMKHFLVILLIMISSSTSDPKTNVIRSVDELLQSLEAYMLKNHNSYPDDLQNVIVKVVNFHEELITTGLRLLRKQMQPIISAVENAKKMGRFPDCVHVKNIKLKEMEDDILNAAREELKNNCQGIEDELVTLNEFIDSVRTRLEDHRKSAKESVIFCTSQFSDELSLKTCIDPIFKEARHKFEKILERKMEMLRYNYEETMEAFEDYMLKCLLRIRGDTLRQNRVIAQGINACVENRTIPLTPKRINMPFALSFDEKGEAMRQHIEQKLKDNTKKFDEDFYSESSD